MSNIEHLQSGQLVSMPESNVSSTVEEDITFTQDEILKSAKEFAEYLTEHWPQVDTELPNLSEGVKSSPQLNYYLSGSLVPMLLSQAESFTEIDDTLIPTLSEIRVREIPQSAARLFSSFARQMGDLDYIPIDHYKTNPKALRKGGGGPSFEDIPEGGRKVLYQGKGQIKLMCNPVEAYGPKRIVKVKVGEQDYYIASPDTILAYKVLHLLQSYNQKPEKFNRDFTVLSGALREIYSEKELIDATNQVLSDYEGIMEGLYNRWNTAKENPPAYERRIPKSIDKVLAHPQLSLEIRTMLEKLSRT